MGIPPESGSWNGIRFDLGVREMLRVGARHRRILMLNKEVGFIVGLFYITVVFAAEIPCGRFRRETDLRVEGFNLRLPIWWKVTMFIGL